MQKYEYYLSVPSQSCECRPDVWDFVGIQLDEYNLFYFSRSSLVKSKRVLVSLMSKLNLEHILHIISLPRFEFWSTKGTALIRQSIVTLIWLRFEGKLRSRGWPPFTEHLEWANDFSGCRTTSGQKRWLLLSWSLHPSVPSNTNTFQWISVCKGIKTGSGDGSRSLF